LWQLSLSYHERGSPVLVPRWGPTKWRKAEAIRDKIMRGAGTCEPWVEEVGLISMHWRRPLSITEIVQMAPTPEVKAREGRA
jgi:hypothetical protein